jgi:peptide deformylase
MVKPILKLGDDALYQVSNLVSESEMSQLAEVVENLHDTLIDYRERYGAGRAIAAPQIGVFKRLIYMYVDEPRVLINPTLEFMDDDMMRVLDDCMSFPGLYVRVIRHKKCRVHYTDLKGESKSVSFEGDLAELIQHEYDHLDGILATMRAIDNRSFVMK